jgi:geranylgeranylglycerol-phosphate geranylgeranyltransferase
LNTKRITGLLRLFRVELPLSAGVCAVLGALLAAGAVPPFSVLALTFLSIFFIAATALILNDYFDYEIDLVNAPERPLPSGMVSKRDVVILSVVVALMGFTASALISVTALLVAIVVWMVGVAYNARFKRSGLPGNLMVSFSVGMTFIFGGIAVGRPDDVLVWWFGLLAGLFDLGEEIAADAMDTEGDRLIGSRSLAIVIGVRKALMVSAGVFSTVVVVSLLPFFLRWLETAYLVPILLMDTVLVVGTARLLSPTAAHPRTTIRWVYLGGTFAILLFVVLLLVL